MKNYLDQKGVIHLLPLIAAVGLLAFILISNTFFFRDNLFNTLFPKPSSFATEDAPGSVRFVDGSGTTITATSSATAKVRVVTPNWDANSQNRTTTSSLVKEARAEHIYSCECGGAGQPCCDNSSPSKDAYHCGQRNGSSCLEDLFCTGNTCQPPFPSPPPYSQGYYGPTPTPYSQGNYYSQGSYIPSPPPTPTPAPITTAIILAEDPGFAKNVKSVGTGTAIKTYDIDYSFSDSTLGTKTLYVKFKASNGQEQNATPFPAIIKLVKPGISEPVTPSPTSSPTPTPRPGAKLPPCGNYGDVNGDGVVTAADALFALRRAGFQDRADVDGNGVVNTFDATLILRYVAGLINTFPVCSKPPVTGVGMTVSPQSVNVTVSRGSTVKALTITSTGATGFQFVGYPTTLGPRINWVPQSSGMVTGKSVQVNVKVDRNVSAGVYRGTGRLKNTTNSQEITFPVTVTVR